MFKQVLQWCGRVVRQGLQWLEQQLMKHTKPSAAVTVVGALEDSLRSRDELIVENAVVCENSIAV